MFGIIVRNLLSNAVKFSDKKAGEIKIESMESDQHIDLSISDNGIGMSSDQLKHIFIVGGSSRGTSDEKGHGIGLPLVKLFCDQLGIDLTVDSKLGSGTKCTLRVPRA